MTTNEMEILLDRNGKSIVEDKFGKIYLMDENNSSVVLLARDTDTFILIKQFRRAVGEYVIQLPGGGVQQGENLEAAAKREFLEETGYECGHVEYLGNVIPASWISNEVTHVFYTNEVTAYTQQSLERHENIEVIRMNIEECIALIKQNKINDSELTYAILQAALKGYITIY